MMIWLRIAFRNILMNTRRSVFTLLAVGVGFAAVNLFGGFQSYVFQGLRDSVIYANAQGHVAIVKKNSQTGRMAQDPVEKLIDPDERKRIADEAEGYPEVRLVTDQMQISGLLSNGETSTIFVAVGRIPSHTQWIQRQARGMIARLTVFSGKPLSDDVSYAIGISAGLAEKLNLSLDADAIAMAPTVDGQINALDAIIYQYFQSPAQELDDKFMQVPLDFAQSLYNTDGVDRVLLLLSHRKFSESVAARLNRLFAREKMDLMAMTWEEYAPFYVKVRDMFIVIFSFLFIIVLVIVVMSVINTMSMAVMERIKEVGTIRAMGVKQRSVLKLFATESLLLSIFGCVLGVGLTIGGWVVVKIVEPTWVPPHISMRVPIEVYMVPTYLVGTGLVLILLSVVAAVFPARKAARMAIVDALGHV